MYMGPLGIHKVYIAIFIYIIQYIPVITQFPDNLVILVTQYSQSDTREECFRKCPVGSSWAVGL